LYIGLALSPDHSTTRLVYAACAPYLSAFAHLVDVYRNFPEVEVYVLQFYEAFVRTLAFENLMPNEIDDLLGALVNLFDSYTKASAGMGLVLLIDC
jgi:hypothetical protein